jgi:hypothetical protein
VRDSDNQRVNEQKHFHNPERYTAVFAITNRFPYHIEVWARGNYTLRVTAGDTSLTPEQTLFANDVFYANSPSRRTPVYVFDIAENTEILVTLVLYGGNVYDSRPSVMSADGIVTEALFLPLSMNRLRLSIVPQGEPPYTFVPGITGAHVVSVVITGAIPEKSVRIRLTTDSTNLRSGATIDAPILREAAAGTVLLAVARNTNGDWLLALTGDGLMVWVFRQLVEPLAPNADVLALPLAPRMLPPEPTATPTALPTITPVVTPTSVVLTLPAPVTSQITEMPTATFTPTPLPEIICTISSGGGVNIRFGPGVNYETAGSLTAGQIRGVIGQTIDTENNIWWQLADATWVRSDLVQEIGDCTTAPRIEISE